MKSSDDSTIACQQFGNLQGKQKSLMNQSSTTFASSTMLQTEKQSLEEFKLAKTAP